MNGGVAETKVRLHVSASLAHSVDLRLLEAEILFKGGRTYNGGYREDTLSSDACKYDVSFHFFACLLAVWMHSRLLMITDTP